MTAKADTAPIRAELEQAAQPSDKKGIIELIRRNKPELEKLLGPSLTVEAFETATMTYLRMNPKLVDCNPYSIVGGLRLGAQLGLSLGPLGHFYLVPFKDEAVFIVGYRGMVELAWRSGKLKRIEAHVVRDGDDFDFRKGSRAFLDFTPRDGELALGWRCVYALAETTTGGKVFEVLYPRDVEARMKRSASHKLPSSPWNTDKEAMWCKTAVRKLQRWLPQTPESAHGLATDETVADLTTDDVQEVGGGG